MIWLWVFLVTYALAGATIGRVAWEFEAFADRANERLLCVVVAFVWPAVPAWALWTALTSKE